MRILFFSSKPYDSDSFNAAGAPADYRLHFQQARLSIDSAALAVGHEVVCAFINDDLSRPCWSAWSTAAHA